MSVSGRGDLATMFRPTRAGCVDLLQTVQNRVKPKYHVFGHIHEGTVRASYRGVNRL